MPAAILYLSVDDVIALHEDTLQHEGGLPGLRSLPLLESAVAMPMQQFGGVDLHETIFDKAAAYMFHLANNHPFNDGNLRVAAQTAWVFLDANGYQLTASKASLTQFVDQVAQGQSIIPEMAAWFSRNCHDDLAEQTDAAEEIFKRYRNTLRELAG